jgi:4-diphosphocytidyl-2-C-methyl-D-erythritol kinase
MTETITLEAQAKINLTLEVLGRRADGYHEIRSVMQRITLADTLTLGPAERLTLECSDPQLEGPDNLVWRAAELLRRASGVRAGAAMRLEKRTPVSAGLGGGSSDCAAALLGLARLWDVDLPREVLMALGRELGSDVPFFLLESPCALAEGRGDLVTALAAVPHRWALPALPQRWGVLVKPAVGISAAAVYHAFPPGGWTDGLRTSAWLDQLRQRGTVPPPFNALEPVALGVAPEAALARRALAEAGARDPVRAGSGSTYFALFEDENEARTVLSSLAAAGWEGHSWIARFVTL